MAPILTDPIFYLAAIPAVILVGLSKGGLGGAMALIGVPLMALVVSPVQAAAILLPILIVMDMVSLWAWRGFHDRRVLAIMLPGAMLGIGIGWLTAAVVTADHVRLIVGIVTLLFFLRWVADKLRKSEQAAGHSPAKGLFWGTVSGFTSFVAHAGGPPYQVYALPLKQDPKLYTGTSVIFFAIVNAAKLVPYFALGQFDATNLTASLMLVPVAPLATLAGAWVVRRMRPEIFYPLMYAMIFVVSLKLIYDGVAGLWGL
ncbi:sulfite exporter TauE/SafE family protein [Chelativorans sp. AA-79]|uniref:sulfite exporter TauE/SafE family protein n=1 Tax=Chelativorans sp. AA-79 TaxID=3028735 RepID=UPI0023F69B66|nr:sulfite exporter TauE/SafE family protein [Chelativorans sp. AA-79]WEX09988.1 sulfite exporter TauE/SafE family protein [Chelativorans sp. AA-79]